jgi:hypothetical protein
MVAVGGHEVFVISSTRVSQLRLTCDEPGQWDVVAATFVNGHMIINGPHLIDLQTGHVCSVTGFGETQATQSQLISTSHSAIAITPTGDAYTFNLQSKEWVDMKIKGVRAFYRFKQSILLLQDSGAVAIPWNQTLLKRQATRTLRQTNHVILTVEGLNHDCFLSRKVQSVMKNLSSKPENVVLTDF